MQPGGLLESSRWSEQSVDHRYALKEFSTPEGYKKESGTPPGCGQKLLSSGGLRCAPTTGYFLSALQAETVGYAFVLILRLLILLRSCSAIPERCRKRKNKTRRKQTDAFFSQVHIRIDHHLRLTPV